MCKGIFDFWDWMMVVVICGCINDVLLYIDDSFNMIFVEICVKCCWFKQCVGFCMVIIDYLQLMILGKCVEFCQQEVLEFF